MSQITFSQTIQGYLLAIGARHLSAHTIRDYVNTFKKFTAFLGDDMPFGDITHKHIEAFFAAQSKVTNKTLLNYHTSLSDGKIIAFSQPGMSITPDGIAKRFIVDEGVARLKEFGFGNVMVETGRTW